MRCTDIYQLQSFGSLIILKWRREKKNVLVTVVESHDSSLHLKALKAFSKTISCNKRTRLNENKQDSSIKLRRRVHSTTETFTSSHKSEVDFFMQSQPNFFKSLEHFSFRSQVEIKNKTGGGNSDSMLDFLRGFSIFYRFLCFLKADLDENS